VIPQESYNSADRELVDSQYSSVLRVLRMDILCNPRIALRRIGAAGSTSMAAQKTCSQQ